MLVLAIFAGACVLFAAFCFALVATDAALDKIAKGKGVVAQWLNQGVI